MAKTYSFIEALEYARKNKGAKMTCLDGDPYYTFHFRNKILRDTCGKPFYADAYDFDATWIEMKD